MTEPAHTPEPGRDDRITLRFMTSPADTAAGGRRPMWSETEPATSSVARSVRA